MIGRFCILAVAAAAPAGDIAAAAPTVNRFTLQDAQGKDALAASGCLTSAASESSHLILHFSHPSENVFDIQLEPQASIFAAGIIDDAVSAPAAYAYIADGIQAAFTFNCNTASTNGDLRGLVASGEEVLEFSTDKEEPAIQNHVGTLKAGDHIAAVRDMSQVFINDANTLSTDDFLIPKTEEVEVASVDGPRRKLAVPRWTNCYTDDTTKRQLGMGIAVGSTLYRNKYNSNKQTAIDRVAEMITKTNLVYGGQLNIMLKVNKFVVAGVDESPSWDNYNSCNPHRMSINTQLSQFTSWAPSANTGGNGLWHLLDDCFAGSGVVGLAWVGTLCKRSNTGVSWYSSRHWLTFAHEVGHNFGGGHSFEEGQGRTGGIMDYGDGKLNGQYQFNSKYRKSQMCKTVNSVVNTCTAMKKVNDNPTPPPAPTPVPPPPCPTTDGGKKAGSKCVFPFTFKRVIYNKCTIVDDPKDEMWCSTKTDSSGKHISGTWAHCSASCPGMPSTPPTPPPTPAPILPTPAPGPDKPEKPGCLTPMSVKQANSYKKQVEEARAEVAELKGQLAAAQKKVARRLRGVTV